MCSKDQKILSFSNSEIIVSLNSSRGRLVRKSDSHVVEFKTDSLWAFAIEDSDTSYFLRLNMDKNRALEFYQKSKHDPRVSTRPWLKTFLFQLGDEK
jgi:hypothetical protein